MSKTILISTLISLSLLFTACSDNKAAQDDANSMLSKNEFILTALDKSNITVKKAPTGFSIKGKENKIVILDIFATWCPPCQAEASHLSNLQKKYKDSLRVIGVSVEDGVADAKLQDFRAEHKANYMLVNSSENSRLIDAVAAELKVGRNFGIPLMAMYKNGKLINYYQGATEEEFIESDIKKALGQ